MGRSQKRTQNPATCASYSDTTKLPFDTYVQLPSGLSRPRPFLALLALAVIDVCREFGGPAVAVSVVLEKNTPSRASSEEFRKEQKAEGSWKPLEKNRGKWVF